MTEDTSKSVYFLHIPLPNILRIAIQFQHDLWRGHSNSAMACSRLTQMAYMPKTIAVPQHLWRPVYPSCCEFISCAGIQRSLSRSVEHWSQPSQDWPWGSGVHTLRNTAFHAVGRSHEHVVITELKN